MKGLGLIASDPRLVGEMEGQGQDCGKLAPSHASAATGDKLDQNSQPTLGDVIPLAFSFSRSGHETPETSTSTSMHTHIHAYSTYVYTCTCMLDIHVYHTEIHAFLVMTSCFP